MMVLSEVAPHTYDYVDSVAGTCAPSPTSGTLSAILSSGRIDSVPDENVRALLGSWPGELQDFDIAGEDLGIASRDAYLAAARQGSCCASWLLFPSGSLTLQELS